MKRGREGNVAAIQSLEDFNAINVLIGAACVFVKPQTHLCSRPTAAFLRRVYSPPRSLQPTTVISPRPRQPASKLRGSAASTFAKEHAACKMEREKKKRTLFCAIHRRPRRAICKHNPTLRRLLYLISHLSARNTIIVLSPMVAQRSPIYFQSEYAEIPR